MEPFDFREWIYRRGGFYLRAKPVPEAPKPRPRKSKPKSVKTSKPKAPARGVRPPGHITLPKAPWEKDTE